MVVQQGEPKRKHPLLRKNSKNSELARTLMEAIIFIGAQASGKSTFYHQKFRDSHIRINLDMLKTRHRESILLAACLEMKQPFVVDNTNPTLENRNRYIIAAKNAGFRIIGCYFESKIQELLQRNALRPAPVRIPEQGIRGTYSRLILPSYQEGFDELFYIKSINREEFTIERWHDEI